MKEIHWSGLAEAELRHAVDWYRQVQDGLEASFLLCVEAALERLLRHPFCGSPVCDDVRRVLIRRFPYGIYYRVSPRGLEIIGIRHFRQQRITAGRSSGR